MLCSCTNAYLRPQKENAAVSLIWTILVVCQKYSSALTVTHKLHTHIIHIFVDCFKVDFVFCGVGFIQMLFRCWKACRWKAKLSLSPTFSLIWWSTMEQKAHRWPQSAKLPSRTTGEESRKTEKPVRASLALFLVLSFSRSLSRKPLHSHQGFPTFPVFAGVNCGR